MIYGVSYKGSKNKIAQWVLDNLPPAENFYDLFAGGCAVTHAALLSGKYEHFHANDIDIAPQLFYDAIHGKYKNETRWISREDFDRLKDKDAYVRYCWSFGNNGKDYLYSKDVEDYKKALHEAIFFRDYERGKKYGFDFSAIDSVKGVKERRLALRTHVFKVMTDKGLLEKRGSHFYFKNGEGWKNIESLGSLQRLQRLQNLESLQSLQSLLSLGRLQSLQSLQSLQISQKDYRKIEIKENSVIYCDIPYRDTNKYISQKKSSFDYEAFYKWCEKQTEPVIISEYYMPSDRFEIFASIEKRQTLNGLGSGKIVKENLYCTKKQAAMIREKLKGSEIQLELFSA